MMIKFERSYRKVHGGVFAQGDIADTDKGDIELIHAQQALSNEAAVPVKTTDVPAGSYRTTDIEPKRGLFKGRR